MSLPNLLTAWRDFVATAISDSLGDPAVPDKKLVHHTKLPDDCCSDLGTLGVWWARADLSTQFPLPLRVGGKGTLGGAVQLYDFGARYNRCWPVPAADDIGSDATYAEYEDVATTLAMVAEFVHCDLLALSCGVVSLGDGVSCEGVRWTSTTPDLSGDCAGIEWHVAVGVECTDGPT